MNKTIRKQTDLGHTAYLMYGMMERGDGSFDELERMLAYAIATARDDISEDDLATVAERVGLDELEEKYATKHPNELLDEACVHKCATTTYIPLRPRSITGYGYWNEPDSLILGFDLSDVTIGDKIMVSLHKLGDFTATAHKITDDDILFVFDDYICKRPMNNTPTNEGGYNASDLKKWLTAELASLFPRNLRVRLMDISIPTIGQILGWKDDFGKEYLELDDDEQLPLMVERRTQAAYFNNQPVCGWFRNAVRSKYSTSDFAVLENTNVFFNEATDALGVRPVFRLAK